MSSEGREPQQGSMKVEGDKKPFAQDSSGALMVKIVGGRLKAFTSGELTGDGTEQSTAHGLGTTPLLVWATPSDLSGGAYTVVYGVHDSTNVKATVTNGEKYRLHALAVLA